MWQHSVNDECHRHLLLKQEDVLPGCQGVKRDIEKWKIYLL